MQHNNEQKTNKSSLLLSWLPYIVIPVLVYFGNIELQSYLGRQALDGVTIETTTFDEALRRAAVENKPILADMSAIWCSACRKLDNEVLSNEKVKQAIEDKYVFTRIEYESEQGEVFMQRYQVDSFPTLLVIDKDGKKLRKLPIRYSPEQFLALL